MMIGVGVAVIVIVGGFLVIYRFVPDIGASWYQLHRPTVSKQQKATTRWYKYLTDGAERIVPTPIRERLERLVRLAGRPYGRSAVDWMLIDALIAVLVAPAALMKKGSLINLGLVVVLVMIPFLLLRSKAKKRKFDAQTQVRSIKRAFRMKLVDGMNMVDALRSVAESTIGEFGQVFRNHLKNVDQSIKIAMQGLRDEYSLPELDEFALALELGEEKTSRELLRELERQIRDEDEHMDDYLSALKDRIKVAQGGAIVALSLVMVLITVAFVTAGVIHMNGQGGLFG